jgi:hypothetical protein
MEGGRSSWTESKTPLIVLLVRRADCCLLPSIQSVNFRESLRTISPRLISSHSKRGPVPDLFEQLKQKYQSVLGTMQKEGAQLRTLHLDGNQLCLKATATSEAGRNPIWKAIKRVDPDFANLKHDIESCQTDQTYTVQAGDDLSRIIKQFYGDPNKSRKIVDDELDDPDKIQAGQSRSRVGEDMSFRRPQAENRPILVTRLAKNLKGGLNEHKEITGCELLSPFG